METMYLPCEPSLRQARRHMPNLKGLTDNRVRYIAQSRMSGPLQGVAQLPSLEEANRLLGAEASACMPQATLMDRAAAAIKALFSVFAK